MINTAMVDILATYPRPIAWAYAEVERARDPVARYVHQLELVEETVRYLALAALARYLDVRAAGGDLDLERELARLRHPSFGDWVSSLGRLDAALATIDRAPFGVPLDDKLDHPACLEVIAHVFGSARKRASLVAFLGAVVKLRNDTKGHGTINPAEAAAICGPLGHAIGELLATLADLAARPPVFVRSIEYKGPSRYVVEVLALIGTGRVMPVTHEVREPGMLEPDHVYRWQPGGDPQQLTPLVHFHQEAEALFLLAGVKGGVPEYTSCQRPNVKHHPDHLMTSFTQRAGFLLEVAPRVLDASRTSVGRATYGRALAQAMADGVVTADEWVLLDTLRGALGLGEAEAAELHDAHDMPARGAVVATREPERPIAPAPSELARARDLDLDDDLDGAIAVLQAVVAAHPDDDRARTHLADLYLEISDHTSAERVCRDGLARAATPALRVALARILLDRNRADQALDQIARARATDPGDVDALVVAIDAWAFEGDFDEVRRMLAQLESIAPTDPRTIAARAEQAYQLGADPIRALESIRTVRARSPRDRMLGAMLVNALENAGCADDADREAADLARRNPRSHRLLALHANQKMMRGEVDAGLDLASRALARYPDSLAGAVTRAYLHVLRASPDLAPALDRLRELAPRAPLVRVVIARCLELSGDAAAAIVELKKLLASSSSYPLARLALATVYDNARDPTRALATVQPLLATYPDHDAGKLAAASAQLALGRFDDAAAALDGLAEQRECVMLVRARILLEQGQHREAERLFREICARNPGQLTARGFLIHALGYQGRADAAVRVFDDAVERQTGLKVQLAQTLVMCGDFDRARRYLRESLDEADALASFDWHWMFQVAHSGGLADLASTIGERGVGANPDSADAHVDHGVALMAIDRARAAAAFRRALAIDDTHAVALNNLAVTLEHDGDVTGALALLEKIPVGDGDLVRAALNRARLFGKLGRGPEAELELRGVLARSGTIAIVEEAVAIIGVTGRPEAAIAIATEQLDRWSGVDRATVYRAIAGVQVSTGDLDAAARSLRDAERLAPDDPRVHRQLGDLHAIAGRALQSRVAYRRAHELRPDDPELATAYARSLVISGELGRVRELYARLATRDGGRKLLAVILNECDATRRLDDGLALARLHGDAGYEGVFLHRKGLHADALPLLADRPAFALVRARCLLAVGRGEDALETVQRELARSPEDGTARRALIDCIDALGDHTWMRDEITRLLEREPTATDAAALRARCLPA